MKGKVKIVAHDCIAVTFNANDLHGEGDENTVMLNKADALMLSSEIESNIHAMDLDDVAGLSNCCCAKIKWTDICSECGEHCEEIDQDWIENDMGGDELRREREV